jgi:hypothetical protein
MPNDAIVFGCLWLTSCATCGQHLGGEWQKSSDVYNQLAATPIALTKM